MGTWTNRILRRRSIVSDSGRTLILCMVVALFFALCILPILYMMGNSVIGLNGQFTFDNYSRMLGEGRQRALLISSASLGVGTAILATLIGAPLGLLMSRADLPGKRLLRLALTVPLVLPAYVLALAWIYVGGSAGLVSQTFGRDLLSGWTYSLTGAMAVLAISLYPVSMLATEAAARRVDGRLEEAALLAAGPPRVLWRITLPLIAPSIAAAALIIFVLTLAEFGVPGLLRVPVFTTEVFTAFASLYDFGAATALAVPLLASALIAGGAAKLLIGEKLVTTRRVSYLGLPIKLGKWRAPVITGVLLVLTVCSVLPIVVLAQEAGRPSRVLAALSASQDAIINSLVLSTVGAALTVAIGLLLGYGRARVRTWLGSLVDLGLIVTFAVPSTVVGIGLIGLWNRPGLPGEIYRSPLIILIGFLARFVPVAALILAASLRQLPRSSEEAANVAGARWPRTFIRIVLPQIFTGIAAAWAVSFIFIFGELGATVLVAPPGESTLPVRIYTIIANSPPSEVAALALMQSGIVLLMLTVLSFLFYRRGRYQKS